MKYRIQKDEDLKLRIEVINWNDIICCILMSTITLPLFGIGLFGFMALAISGGWDIPKEARGKSFDTKEDAEKFLHNNIIRETHYIDA